VISFGSEFNYLTDENCPLVYNQENLEKATDKINSFSADMGGTELLNPLKAAIAMDPPASFTGKGYKKMIFMLTDGETENANECIEEVKSNRKEDTLIHSFGIGNDCDAEFCQSLSYAGNGVCEILKTDQVGLLRAKVVETLSKTLQPSLKEVSSNFSCSIGGKPVTSELTAKNLFVKEHEIYRNQLFSEFIVLSKKNYEQAKDQDLYYDLSYLDELKGTKVHVRVNKPDFVMIPEGEMLTKIAAHYAIKKLEQQSKGTEELAVKYQVLSKLTAFIGVVKQADKVISSEELKRVTIAEASLSRSLNLPTFNFNQAFFGCRPRTATKSKK
jgi:hypothetical protein